MRKTLGTAAVGWVLVLSGARAAAPPAAARPVAGDAQDLIVLHKSRPYLLRLHLQVDGRSFQAGWGGTVAQLFRHLDADGDGALSPKEAKAAPSATQWRQLLEGADVEPDPAPPYAELAGGAGKKGTAAGLQAYYRRTSVGALQADWLWQPRTGDPLGDALFRQLDADKDGKLSKAELLAAAKALGALDADADEMVTPGELNSGFDPLPVRTRGAASGPAAGGLPFFLREPGEPAAPLVEALLATYDRDKDDQLSRAEAGLDKAMFDRLDKDGDGQLDAAELARWADQAPDLQLIVPLEAGSRRPVVVVGGPLRAKLSTSWNGSLLVTVQDWQVELIRREVGPRGARKARSRAEAVKTFRELDKDGSGFVESAEVSSPPFYYVPLLRLADGDGDGKVSEKEFISFEELKTRLYTSTASLVMEDRGRSLYRYLDADGDGRLSRREARNAWARLAPWAGPKADVARAALPRQFRLTLSSGRILLETPEFTEPGGFVLNRGARMVARPGPLWYRKMDRNGDGDVSAAEFLGTDEQFRAIDADGDGLISLEEAEKADAKLRAKKK